jgi:hypothetical protein
MRLYDGGYSARQYNPESLRDTAKRIAAVLPQLMQHTGAQAVAVTGKSGLSLAFATLMLVDFPLIVVRKRGENTHGSSIEGTPGVSVQNYLILDDFVASGATVQTIVTDLARYGVMQSPTYTPPKCVGVLQYDTCDSRSRDVGTEEYAVPCFDIDWQPEWVPEVEAKPSGIPAAEFIACRAQLVAAYGGTLGGIVADFQPAEPTATV